MLRAGHAIRGKYCIRALGSLPVGNKRRGQAPPPPPRADPRELGAALLVVLFSVGLAGIPLALLYVPTPGGAHASVERLSAGWTGFLRAAHAWGAAGAVALALLHAARAYVAGSVPAVRGRAVAGVAALALLIATFFAGTILPWDQQSWEALQHLRNGAGLLGIPLPGKTPGEAPVGVVFWAHVLALPAALVAILAFHLARAGWRPDLARVVGRVRSALPLAAVVLLLLAAASLLAPASLGPAPIPGLSVSRPDWPFLWLVPLQDAVGPLGLLALPLALGALALGVWKGGGGTARGRAVIVVAIAVLFAVLTLLAVS